MTSRFILFISAFITLGATGAALAAGPDYAREARLRAEIIDNIVIGEAIDLNDGARDFLAIMTEEETNAAAGKSAVLILHGRGYHPAWPIVAQPLRVALPEAGWATLSLQMPVLAQGAKYYDYVPILPAAHGRIAAGLAYLRDMGYERVVVLAHSCGVHMMMSYTRAHGDGAFDGYIGIGMGATDYGQPMRRPLPLDKITKPVLDIYGDRDFPAVLRFAPRRADMIRAAGNPQSRQVVIPGADHYYQRQGEAEKLTAAVSAWLEGL